MSNRVKIASWILLALALCAWIGVGYAANLITSTARERSNATQQALTKANQAALNQRVEALAASTKDKREALSALAGTDIVAIVDTIDAAGKSAGITAKVSDAAVAGTTQLGKSGDSLRAVVFNVQGDGSFVQIMHAAELYEKMPLIASIDQFDIQKNQSSDPKAPAWHLTARIRVQTLIQVSI